MSMNLCVHAILAALMVWLLASGSWRRVLKNWPPKRRLMRFAIAGLLLVAIAGVGLAFLTGPNPWQYTAASVGLYGLAVALGLWSRRAHSASA